MDQETAEGPEDVVVQVPYEDRSYPVTVRVPASLGSSGAPKLVLDLHSSYGNVRTQRACSRLDAYADDRDLLIAWPEGAIPAPIPDPLPPELAERIALAPFWIWAVPGVPTILGRAPGSADRDDVSFLTAVIDTLGARFGTGSRAFLTGLSGGARMVSAYALQRPDRVLGIAPVAGLRCGAGATPELPDGVAPEPVPVIAFHGDADDLNSYDGSDDPRWSYSVPDAAAAWSRRNGNPGTAAMTPVGLDDDQAVAIAYGSDPRRVVLLYRIIGGTHSWPGSDDPAASRAVDASALIADFIAARG